MPDVILWCDVQLTKDGIGICLPDVKLENSTDIAVVFKNRKKVYLVNGVPTEGFFSVDFTFKELSNVIRKSEFSYSLFSSHLGMATWISCEPQI